MQCTQGRSLPVSGHRPQPFPQVPLLYRHVHRKHHARHVQRACEALRLTLAEQFLDVACSVAAVNLTRAHPFSRCLYNVAIVYMTVELHCGAGQGWDPRTGV